MVFTKVLGKYIVENGRVFGILFLVAILLQSCVSMQQIAIDVVYPAKTNLPLSIKNLSVINHALLPNSDDLDKKYKLDSTLALYLITDVGEMIGKSPRFSSVIHNDTLFYRDNSSIYYNLKWNIIDSIIAINNTDAVVSLEEIKILDTTIQWTYFDGLGYYYQKDFFLIVESLWKYYIPQANKVYSKTFYDTLNFNELIDFIHYNNMVNEKTGRDWIAAQISTSHFVKITGYIAPYWGREYRMYYMGGFTELKRANNYMNNSNYNKATEIWKKYADGDNRLASICNYNLAVVSEMQGDIDMALTWINKSINIRNNDISASYLRQLQTRKEQKEILDKQFGN